METIKYIDTGVNWLGKIPSTWESKRIKMLTRVKRGASPRPIDNPNYFDEEGEFAWVRIADVTASERYLENTTQRLSELGSSLSVKRYPYDFFLSIAGTVGKPIITKIKCCIHDGFVYFPDLKINPEFLYYIFSTGLPYLGLGKMGTQLNLNTDTIGDIYIPIPDDKEVEKIVKFLDERTTEIDNVIKKKEKLIECLNEEKIALIHRLVTKGLSEKVNFKETQIDWIGEIPEHWDCKRTKMLSRVKRGASPRPIDNPIYFDYEGEFAWVRIADLTASERYLYDTTQRLSELGCSLSVKRYPNDFFLSIAGTVGKPIITKIKCCIHDGFVYFPDLKINPEFLYYIFSTGLPYLGLGKMGTQLNLNTDTVGDIYIPLPKENEIDDIVKQLDLQTGKIDGTIRKINTEIDLIKEYRTSLINEVVTGKITLN